MTDDARNPYAPPTAPLERPPETGVDGSIDDAVAGRYDFTVGEVMDEAWGLVHGFKGSFWGAALVILIIVGVASFFARAVTTRLYGGPPPLLLNQLVSGALGVIFSPLTVGLRIVAVRRASGFPNSFGMAFVGLARIPLFIGGTLVITLITYLGFALLVLPGLYFAVAYGMTLSLLAFRNMPVWTAMETSRRAITHKWFRILGLYLLVALIILLSALPLGIGLIWTFPWGMLVSGVLYRRMFGAPVAAAESAP